MKCSLEIISGIYDGLLFEFETFPIRIGRSDTNDIAIILDDAASREHAELSHENSNIYIKDLKSTNSTYVNGQKVIDGGQISLNDDDEIKVGETYIKFNIV